MVSSNVTSHPGPSTSADVRCEACGERVDLTQDHRVLMLWNAEGAQEPEEPILPSKPVISPIVVLHSDCELKNTEVIEAEVWVNDGCTTSRQAVERALLFLQAGLRCIEMASVLADGSGLSTAQSFDLILTMTVLEEKVEALSSMRMPTSATEIN